MLTSHISGLDIAEQDKRKLIESVRPIIKAPTLCPNNFDYVKSFKIIIDEQEFDDEVDMLDMTQLDEQKTL